MPNPSESSARAHQPPPPTDGGALAANIMHFGRVLRRAGLPVGPGRILQAVQATAALRPLHRDDFYWALHSLFVNRRDQREIFDQAFHVFWRNPKLLERAMALLLPTLDAPPDERSPEEEVSRRLAEAMSADRNQAPPREEEREETQIDASLTWSDREVLQTMDFEKMSGAEIEAAKRAMSRLTLPLAEVATRRFTAANRGRRLDMRNTLRHALRKGGGVADFKYRRQRTRPPPLVVLCDISGSMSNYARMLLHFLHALTNDRDRVHTFLFGTRLTNVTRYLRQKDIDVALAQVAEAVVDWSGGTRIGASLHRFNTQWSRRVLGQGAVVLLITDGLDRDGGDGLAAEIERLHKSCRRLIWLNPLLRYDGYAPKSQGARVLMPYVDEFRPVHNLDSLAHLAAALSAPPGRRKAETAEWIKMIEMPAH